MWMGGQLHAPASFPSGKTRYPLCRRLGGPQGRVWTGAEKLAPTGIRSPDRPARSESLYRLKYLGPFTFCVCVCVCVYIYIYFFFAVELRPNAGHGLLILEVSRSHTTTHHIRQDSSRRVISPSQRPLPNNTQHTQQTNIHARGGIRTHDLSRRATADLRLRPGGHWDRLTLYIIVYNFAPVVRANI